MKNPTILLVAVIIASSCRKEVINPPGEPTPIEDLEILWSTRIADNSLCISMLPTVFNENIIFSASESIFNNEIEPLIWLDTADGEVQYLWSDFFGDSFSPNSYNTARSQDRLVIARSGSITVINASTGQTLWKNATGFGETCIGEYNGYIYKDYNSNVNGYPGVILARTSVDSESWEVVLSYTDSTNLSHGFSGYHFTTDGAGNELVIMRDRKMNYDGTITILDVIAYDLTNDTLKWVAKNLEPGWAGSNLQLNSTSNTVVVPVMYTTVGLDKETGSVDWSYSMTSGCPVTVSGVYVDDEDILIHPRCTKLYSLKPSTGQPNWVMSNVQPQMFVNEMLVENGYVFVVGLEGIEVFDSQSGELVGGPYMRNLNSFSPGVTVDWDQRKLYFAAKNKAYCARLPDHIR